jgi:hypothetical protein
MAAHRYWRINITAIAGGSLVELCEVQMATQQFGKNVCSGGTVLFSTQFDSSTHAAANAFDQNIWGDVDFWTSSGNVPQYIGYDLGLGNSADVQEINIWPTASTANRNPTAFDVQWSDDGSTWTTYWSRSGISWTTSPNTFQRFTNTTRTYSGSPYGTHAYWRMTSLANAANNIVTVAEMQYRATPGGSNEASGGTPSASTTFSGDPASSAFDANASTFWASGTSTPENWLQYQFASAVSVAEVTLQAESASPNRAPTVFAISFSDDGTTWTTAWEVTSVTTWTSGLTQTFTDPSYKLVSIRATQVVQEVIESYTNPTHVRSTQVVQEVIESYTNPTHFRCTQVVLEVLRTVDTTTGFSNAITSVFTS